MAKKNIFISYDYDGDKNYKNMLLAWDANKDFDFNFEDHSADVSINSTDAAAIKRAISAKINNATYFFALWVKTLTKLAGLIGKLRWLLNSKRRSSL